MKIDHFIDLVESDPRKNYKNYFSGNNRFIDREAELGRPLKPEEFPDHDNSAFIDDMIDHENAELWQNGSFNCAACGEVRPKETHTEPCPECGEITDMSRVPLV